MVRLVAVSTADILYDRNKRVVGERIVYHDGSVADRIIERDAAGRVVRVTDTRRAHDVQVVEADGLPEYLDHDESGPIYLTEADLVEGEP